MKQPVNWGQLVAILVTIVTSAWLGTISMNNRISKLEEKVEYTKEQYHDLKNQLNSMQMDIRAILVSMKDKEDRK
jgi:hypothetical protein